MRPHYQGQYSNRLGLTPATRTVHLKLVPRRKGLEIPDTPCTLMGQAPGTAEEINSFCSLNYRPPSPHQKLQQSFLLWGTGSKASSASTGKRHRTELLAKFVIDQQGHVAQRSVNPKRYRRLDPRLFRNKIKSSRKAVNSSFLMNEYLFSRLSAVEFPETIIV